MTDTRLAVNRAVDRLVKTTHLLVSRAVDWLRDSAL